MLLNYIIEEVLKELRIQCHQIHKGTRRMVDASKCIE